MAGMGETEFKLPDTFGLFAVPSSLGRLTLGNATALPLPKEQAGLGGQAAHVARSRHVAQ